MNGVIHLLAYVLRVLLEDSTRGHTRELRPCIELLDLHDVNNKHGNTRGGYYLSIFVTVQRQ